MGIIKIDAYGVECDRCKKMYEDGFTGISFWADENEAFNNAQENSDWTEVNGKHYCPNCFTVDEETGKITIKN